MAKITEYTPTEKLFSLDDMTQEQVNYLYSLVMLTDASHTFYDDTDSALFDALSEAATGQYEFEIDAGRLIPKGFKLYEN